MIGNELDDYKHLEHLTPVVHSGIRRLFSIITKDDLYEQVWVLCLLDEENYSGVE